MIIGIYTGSLDIATAWRDRLEGVPSGQGKYFRELEEGSETKIKGWKDYYALSKAPDGYEFWRAEDDGVSKSIIFSDQEGNVIDFGYSPNDGGSFSGGEGSIPITVNGNEGYIKSNDEANFNYIFWYDEERFFTIRAINRYLSEDELYDLAVNAEHVE